jgi:hypothetical protein
MQFWVRLRFGRRKVGKGQRAGAGKGAIRCGAGANSIPGSKDRFLGIPVIEDTRAVYQTRQELAGYMGWPLVHPKALPKASKFRTAPFVRQRPGE